MTEQYNKLTQNINNPRLDSGDIFMPEDVNEDKSPEQKPPTSTHAESANLTPEEHVEPEQSDSESEEDSSSEDNRAKAAIKERKEIAELLSALDRISGNDIQDKQIIAEVFGNLTFQNWLHKLYPDPIKRKVIEEEFASRIKAGVDKDDRKSIAEGLVSQVHKHYIEMKMAENQGAFTEIKDLQGVSEFIVEHQDKELWGKDGELPLVDEQGRFDQANFLKWMRYLSLLNHYDQPNTAMSPLFDIVLEAGIRQINLYMMTQKNREQYFRDKQSGKVLHDLAEETLNEAFGFGVYRNTSLAYRQVMTSDTKLPEQLLAFHANSDLTRGDLLARMYAAPGEFGEEGDTKVGDAIMLSNDIYYHISDKDKLVAALGDNPITEEDFRNALRIIQKKQDWNTDPNSDKSWNNLDSHEGHYDKNEGKFFAFEADGKTKRYLFDQKGNIDMDTFSRLMNFYNEAVPKTSSIELFRELVRLKISQKYDLSAGIALTTEEINAKKALWEKIKKESFEKIVAQKLVEGSTHEKAVSEAKNLAEKEAEDRLMLKRKADRINIFYAETTSFEMQRPYGIAARNDVGRRGYDATTKLYLQDYLIRQSGENTAGPIGIPEEIPIFKSLSPDMWTGLKTESGMSPYAIYEKIRIIENSNDPDKAKQKQDLLDKLRFRDKAEYEYASNQQSQAFTIFHSISGAEQLDLNKIVTFSPLEGVRYVASQFEKQVKDDFIKPLRYAFSSNGALDYNSTVRWHDYSETRRQNSRISAENKKRIKRGLEPIPPASPVYKDVKLAEAMFGNQVLEGVTEDYNSTEGRQHMMKNIAKARIAAQLKYHRKLRGTGERWDATRAEVFIRALETIRELEMDPENPDKVRETGGRFFSKEAIAWIRKQSGTGFWTMFREETAVALATGTFEGILKMIKVAVQG